MTHYFGWKYDFAIKYWNENKKQGLNEGEVVLDSCAGSMTTAIAAIDLSRKVICIEKDKDIFEVGRNRVWEHLEEKGIFNALILDAK